MTETKEEIKFKTVKKSVSFYNEWYWLNKQGLAGWELYNTVTSYKNKTRTYYFRKPQIK
jgi:hypothetical protein